MEDLIDGRCGWCGTDPLYAKYHDEEWGVPVRDDRKQFEYLMMEAMQCGLNWNMMIQKREIFRECFEGFDFQKVAAYPFDFVIGSSHLVHGIDPYYTEYFEGKEEDKAYREYFESILENLAAFDCFDVYGHIDYIVRYGPNQNQFYSYGKFADVIDEILRTIIQKGEGN